MKSLTASQWYQSVYDALLPTAIDPRECTALNRGLLAHFLGYDLNQHILDVVLTASSTVTEQLEQSIQRLQKREPIQYILGYTHFLGHHLTLTPAVLIPRRETEEMVATLIQEVHRPPARILDIGTGSGCIAIALKQAYPKAEVTAIDVSTQALALAQRNADANRAVINFVACDFLQDQQLHDQTWDLIVSNPPYIPYHEKSTLAKRVKAYEPDLALFVPDGRPLIFYEKIATLTQQQATRQGSLYVEIHEAFGTALLALFRDHGLQHAQLQQDLQGKDRWISYQRG